MLGAVKILNDLQNLFFPGACLCCKSILAVPEQYICVKCRHILPLTHFTDRRENPTERIFYGRVKIEEATSLLWFHKKGPVQHLIHQIKYRGQQKAGTLLGQWLGEEMNTSSRFDNIDLVIPMPLQRKKQRQRGYNQTATFARALATQLNAEYRDDILWRTDDSPSFAFRGRQKRALDQGPVFKVNPLGLNAYNHILITDDVVTTGTTLESAVNTLLDTSPTKVSIATMAITS